MPKRKPTPIQGRHKVDTIFLLLAQYGATAVIPVDLIARDYFPHLSTETLIRKISSGSIALPLLRMEDSRETMKGVHPLDLARWIDERAEAARKECQQLAGT